ncbi:hypothetical protein EON76_02250 [bacterium]|nr:MAG: hypothetical protein EON76_02250 [bacterium]
MSKKIKRERQQREFKNKMLLFAVGGVLIVTLVGVIGYFAYQSLQGRKDEPNVIDQKAVDEAVSQAGKNGKLRDEAQAQIQKNDTAKAGEIYKTAIDAEAEVNKKIELYIDLANTYYSAGKLDDAIVAAKRAESLSSDKFLAADWLSRAYKVKKEYTTAIEYYTIAGNSVDSPQNVYKFDKAYYDEEIATVKKIEGESQ